MDNKVLHRVFGLLAFLIALVVYSLTVQPTVPFWDCGEFSAAAIWQQVPHPPGAPLFLIVGKLFHLLIPFGDPGWKINMVSVLSSAVTVWFIYAITVMIIKNFKKDGITTMADGIAVYGSAFVGATALTFSDTFWFNAVESEVYAASSLFVGIIVYLMMRWNEEADNPGNEKYILLIAYLIGLSTGVHLLSIFTIFAMSMLVYFRKYTYNIKSFLVMGIIACVMFFTVYPGIVQKLPKLLAGDITGVLAAVAMILAVAFGFYYGWQKKLPILQLVCSSLLLVLMGYTTYTQILIRSNANPPMNENEPKNFKMLTSYLGREQYGHAPTWPRRYQEEGYFVQNYVEKDVNGDFVYGPWYKPTRENVRNADGSTSPKRVWKKVNAMGEFAYLFKYQINHMYFRYLNWNFVGRESDVQDADFALLSNNSEALNHDSGYKDIFPIRFWGIPLLFGLFGLIFHGYKDRKMALVYFVTFLLMGVLTAIYQNQQDPQPRERDYFYAGSFMIYCIWIGLGTYGLIAGSDKKKISAALSTAVVTVAMIIVPLNMAIGGWTLHSRAGNFLPFDYSYNLLQSVEKDAIMFTNGDNDTFPVWYLQDVMGVRRDVRIVNLSLGNTLWYVDQVKNRQPWGSKEIPLSFADDSIQVHESDPKALSYDFGEATSVRIPVRKEILAKYTSDPAIINSGYTTITLKGKPYQKMEGKQFYLFRVQDRLLHDILKRTRFERPIYFSATVGGDAFVGLEPHFRSEGLAYRICPVPQTTSAGKFDEANMDASLLNIDNTENFSTEQKFGFKLRNLNNRSVYYDEVARRLMGSYRHLYMTYADYQLRSKGDKEKALKVLNTLNENVSIDQFPINYDYLLKIMKLYQDCGDQTTADMLSKKGVEQCKIIVNNRKIRPELTYYEATGRYMGPHRHMAMFQAELKDYAGANKTLQLLISKSKEFQQGAQKELQARIQFSIFEFAVTIEQNQIKEIAMNSGPQAALDSARKISARYLQNGHPIMQKFAYEYIQPMIADLEKLLQPDSSEVISSIE